MDDRVRKIAVAGVLGAVAVLLGATHWGFIPWFAGAALTVMHVPAIIGAVLEGPIVGLAIGLIFGLFSIIQAAVAPTGPWDPLFTNPLISVLPRLLIGPAAWLVYKALVRLNELVALAVAGIIGSFTNTALVLGMIGVVGGVFGATSVLDVVGTEGGALWALLWSIAAANGLPEAGASAVITVLVVAAWKRIAVGRRKGSSV